MSTARELELIMAETERRLAPMRARVSRLADDLLVAMVGREVCARRARTLRQRGERVAPAPRTSTGKARFAWVKRITWSEAPRA